MFQLFISFPEFAEFSEFLFYVDHDLVRRVSFVLVSIDGYKGALVMQGGHGTGKTEFGSYFFQIRKTQNFVVTWGKFWKHGENILTDYQYKRYVYFLKFQQC